MSQSITPSIINDPNPGSPAESESTARISTQTEFVHDHDVPGEFDYRPVPVIAPITFALGVLASIGLMGVFGLVFGLCGTVLGIISILRIRKSGGELGGRLVAWTGFVLSFMFLVSGTSLHAYTFATEVPEGYKRVNFYRDISKKPFVLSEGKSDFHPEVKALDGQKIFLKGYMYPTMETQNLKSFLFVKDSGQCCFGGQPQATDMMVVSMQGDKTVNYKEGMVSVAGVFHCRPTSGPAGLEQNPVYVLDGDMMESSRTRF